jgi:thioredoxin reductase
MLVIGGGAGGLVTAAGSVGIGAKVCLIENNFLGGDCLNTGCVPSKAFLKCANVVHQAMNCTEYGVKIEGSISVDFPKIMQRMRKIRAHISDNDSAERFSKSLGVDVYLGLAKFTGPNTVEVNGKTLKFMKACIATGARPKLPPIKNLGSVLVPMTYYTSDNIFNLTT